MTKENIIIWIEQGYTVMQGGGPKKVDGDLKEWLDKFDEEDNSALILNDLLELTDEELHDFLSFEF